MRTISEVFVDLEQKMTGERVSIDNILEALHERGFGFLLLIFAAPMALPIPVPPGINIILASPLILLTAQQAIGRHTIWLPQFVRKKSMKRDKMVSVFNAVIPWMKKLEVIVKPRFEFVTHGMSSNIIGILGLVMALAVCVPLPFTNTVPSLGIALMAVGVIMRDGLAVLAGSIIGTLWVSMLIFVGIEGFGMITQTIKSFLW